MGPTWRDLLALRAQPPTLYRWALGTLAVVLVVCLWWLLTLAEIPEERWISPAILPSPGEVVASAGSLFSERALIRSVVDTLQRVLFGFGLAILIGVPLGILAGSWRALDAFCFPLDLLGRNIPLAALIPLTILWFGIDEAQKVMFIFIACMPFIFRDTVGAVIAVHDRYVETAQTLGASRWQIVLKVLVPQSLPTIYHNLRVLFGLAFGYIMLAEVINADHGLGKLINTSQRQGPIEHIVLILLIIGLLAYAIDRLLFILELGFFPHKYTGDRN